MAIDVDGDIENIISCGDFDVAVEIWNKANTDRLASVRGIFTDRTEQVNVWTGEIEAVNPMVDCATSRVTGLSIVRGCIAVINATNYTIERIQVNGTGITTFHLKT